MSSESALCDYEIDYEEIESPEGWKPEDPQYAEKRVDDSLRSEITRAQALLEISDPDEELPIFSRDALDRAIAFLKAQSAQFHKMYKSCAPVPQIGAGPNGSVDLHWKEASWELLVNIPSDREKMAAFYGDDYGIQNIKGSLDPRKFNYGIIAWLTHK